MTSSVLWVLLQFTTFLLVLFHVASHRAFSLNVLRNASAAVEKGVDMMTLIQVCSRGRLRVFGAPVATDR